MIKYILTIIKGWFTPKKTKDEHLVLYEDMPKPDVPVHVDPCPRHTRFIQKCHMCVAAAKGINL